MIHFIDLYWLWSILEKIVCSLSWTLIQKALIPREKAGRWSQRHADLFIGMRMKACLCIKKSRSVGFTSDLQTVSC